MSNLNSVALTVLELLAFNAQKIRGSSDPDNPSLLGKFLQVMSGLCLGTRVSNLKSVALTVLELLEYNAQKFRGHVTVATPLFGKVVGDHVRTVPGNPCVKFEVRSFKRFGAIGI